MVSKSNQGVEVLRHWYGTERKANSVFCQLVKSEYNVGNPELVNPAANS